MKNNLLKISRNILILGLILSPFSASAESTMDPSLLVSTNSGSSAQTAPATVDPSTLVSTNSGSSAQTPQNIVDPSTLVSTNSGSSAQTAVNPSTLVSTNSGSSAQTPQTIVDPSTLVSTNSGSSAQTPQNIVDPSTLVSTNSGSSAQTPPSSNPGGSTGGSTNSGGSTGGSTNPGSSSGGSSSGGGGRSGGSSGIVYLANCNYLTSYMKIGANNNKDDVLRLQTYLRVNEGMTNVNINGIFDTNTFEAVKKFQSKYSNDVLKPWNIKNPTGSVFYTTQKKINELVCKKDFALTKAQLAHIESYKKGDSSTSVKVNDIKPIKSSDEKDIVVELDADNTATTVNTSTASKIWKFTKWLFGF